MIKIEADTLEKAYENAAASLKCSVTELVTEVVQHPKVGYFGLFKKTAIIVATRDVNKKSMFATRQNETTTVEAEEPKIAKSKFLRPKFKKESEEKETKEKHIEDKEPKSSKIAKTLQVNKVKSAFNSILGSAIPPVSFVNDQDEDEEDLKSGLSYTADYDDEFDEDSDELNMNQIVQSIDKEINSLFDLTCFEIDKIDVSVYDEETVLVEFKGEDAALLIGKEGYRYKAISYMLFNWINLKYKVQIRLEIAEFLKNQEESVSRYIESVCDIVDKDGRAQTKILDGVLVQIALKELREKYPQKYVVIRSTRDGLKYIIVNDYHSNQ